MSQPRTHSPATRERAPARAPTLLVERAGSRSPRRGVPWLQTAVGRQSGNGSHVTGHGIALCSGTCGRASAGARPKNTVPASQPSARACLGGRVRAHTRDSTSHTQARTDQIRRRKCQGPGRSRQRERDPAGSRVIEKGHDLHPCARRSASARGQAGRRILAAAACDRTSRDEA